jgi:hypothetical protein
VGQIENIILYAPRDAYFSYFNSPYTGHELGTSIDIYPSHQEYGGSVTSPINGTINRIQKIKMGRERNFPTEPYDFGIALKPERDSDDIVRILHCIPEVGINDRVDIGDHIGFTIRSRYFNYWTGPHYHVDVMNEKDFGRASKSYPLTLCVAFSSRSKLIFQESIECEIIDVSEDILIAVSKDYPTCHADEIAGLAATCNESKTVGVLDGGVSHYGHGGIWTNSLGNIGEEVNLWNHPIGRVSKVTSEYCLFKKGPGLEFKIDGLPVRGLSCFIFSKHQLIQGLVPLLIIPSQRGEYTNVIEEGDVCLLSVQEQNSRIKS